MQVLAVNSSPHKAKGNTEQLLAPFIEGLRTGGAAVEQRYLADYEINFCKGCFGCWTSAPGRCTGFSDGMDELLPDFLNADMVVLAFPLYFYGFPAQLKAFIDRLLPIAEPWMVPHPSLPGLTTHPRRAAKPAKLFFISTAGLPEFVHFRSLTASIEHLCEMLEMELSGMALLPAAGLLHTPQLAQAAEARLALLREAGRELGQGRALPMEMKQALASELAPGLSQAYNENANAYWQRILDAKANQ
jgi:putative NADPH-quinone reductase